MLKNILIYMIAAIFAFLAATNSLASILKKKQSATALMAPFFFNGFAAEKASSLALKKIVIENQNQIPSKLPKDVSALAVNSFLAEPTAAESIAIIALPKNDNTRRGLMKQSHNLSQRETWVTAWLIQDSSVSGDIDEVLKYYDVNIRTDTNAANILLSVMVDILAIEEQTIAPFHKLLSKNPPWANQFWARASARRVSTNGSSVKNTAILRKKMTGEDPNIYADETLIRTLISDRLFDEAKSLRSFLVHNGNNKKAITEKRSEIIINHSFKSQPQYAPLDWQLYSNGEYGASIADGKLYLSAIRNSGGLFARQLIYLPTQSFNIKVNLDKVTENNDIFLKLVCAEKKVNKINDIRIKLENKTISKSLNNARGLCQYYWLNIEGRTSNDDAGLDAVINSVSIS